MRKQQKCLIIKSPIDEPHVRVGARALLQHHRGPAAAENARVAQRQHWCSLLEVDSFTFSKKKFLFRRKNMGQKLQGQGARGGGEVPQPQDGLGVVRGRHRGGHGEHGVHQVHAEAGLPGILLPLPEPAELPQVGFARVAVVLLYVVAALVQPVLKYLNCSDDCCSLLVDSAVLLVVVVIVVVAAAAAVLLVAVVVFVVVVVAAAAAVVPSLCCCSCCCCFLVVFVAADVNISSDAADSKSVPRLFPPLRAVPWCASSSAG